LALRYRAVLFDLDGTLVDSCEDIIGAVHQGLGAVGIFDPPAPEDIIGLIGQPIEQLPQGLGYHLTLEQVQQFSSAFRDYYAQHHQDHVRVYPHVMAVLERLRAGGVKTGLVTTKRQDQAEAVARTTGLAPLIDHIHGWAEGRAHKPRPEPLLQTLTALGAVPTDALMVGDSELDILAARAAGLDCCAVAYGYRPVPYLYSFSPDYLIGDLSDLVPIVIVE